MTGLPLSNMSAQAFGLPFAPFDAAARRACSEMRPSSLSASSGNFYSLLSPFALTPPTSLLVSCRHECVEDGWGR